MTKRYGIDLGTTYSTISWYDESRQEVKPLPLESEDGETTSLRSVVYYPESGEPVMGEVAWNTRKQVPERVIVGIKRKMGEDYQTEEIDGRRRSPQEVSADVLRALKDNAEIEMGEEVTDVVITVPAYFGERQCAATMEAAKMAGLNVLSILSEPHAAAVAFSIEQNSNLTDKHVLVYDLGGGTFDVTLIQPVIPAAFADNNNEVQDLKLNTLAKDGNRELGGLDWDEILIDLAAEKCIDQFDVDPRLDPRNAAVLHDNCEKAKRALSKKPAEMIVADLQGHMIEVTRDEFEERSSGLLLQTQMRLEQVLSEAEEKHGITRDQIDVLLCGGATRMPRVKAMIQEVMGSEPLEYRNPQLLVACGAAYVSHAIDPQASIPLPGPGREATEEGEEKTVRIAEDSITDITCHAVGIQVIRADENGERKPFNAVVLERGVVFGEKRDFVTETLFDNQAEVCIRLFEGDDQDVEECKHLMDFRIEGLPAGRPRGRPIRTTLWFGLNGVIQGTAVDLETNTEIEIHYDRWGMNTPAPAAKPATPQQPAAETPAPMPMPGSQPSSMPEASEPEAEPVIEVEFDETPVLDVTPMEDAPAEGPFDPAQPYGEANAHDLPESEVLSLDDSTPAPVEAEPQDAPQAAFDAETDEQPSSEEPVSNDTEPVAETTPSEPAPAASQDDGSDQDSESNDPPEMPKPLKLY
ncbi:MAG: hypothetical protein DHS20C15_07810 [Planctomycetota bacterium]|nr:MAG: hypothetical protein DHS20C15_07810 [Planctomycetota bacterium]